MLKQKIIENYFDATSYTNQEIMEKIEETKKEFSKKITNVDINLNEFGVYVVTYYFEVKENLFQKIFIKIKKTVDFNKKSREERKKEKIKKRLEKYSGNKYGVYKETKTYKPY